VPLQKSKVAPPQILRENTKQETIADSHILNRVGEVACEFKRERMYPPASLHENRAYSLQKF